MSNHFFVTMLFLGATTGVISQKYKDNLTSIAEYYATEQFGDFKPPLDQYERKQWLDYIGAKNQDELTIPKLLKYIQEREFYD